MGNRFLFTAAFFNFIGYYLCLMLLFYMGLSSLSLNLSIPLRILILACLVTFFLQSGQLKAKPATYLFLFFSVIYLSRIFIDAIKGQPYYLETSTLILYYLSFDMIPFLLIANIKFKAADFDQIRKGILLSGFLFSILATIFFNTYIGTVGRLTSTTAEADMLSPLALSYCSSLAIGISVSYWIENKVTLLNKYYLLTIIVLSAIPFFLGSSRGSLIALILPFIFILILKKNAFLNLRIIAAIIIFSTGIIYFSDLLGSNLIERFAGTTTDMSEGSDSAIRTIMWGNSFDQFTNNPIIGDKLKLDGFNIYPHNILFEILQSTGLLGFIPFITLTGIAFIKSFKIFKYAPKYSWISIIFMQCFIQNMFSGGISSASWLMMSMALVLAFTRRQNELYYSLQTLNKTVAE